MVSQIKVNEIIKQSGSSITIGESGDTVSIPSGATFNVAGSSVTAVDNTPYFIAGKGGSQTSVSDNAYTQVTYVTEVADSGDNYASSTFTAPSAGNYFFSANVTISPNSGNAIQTVLQFYKNGSGLDDYRATLITEGMEIAQQQLVISGLISLAASDTIKVYAKMNTDSGNATFADGQFSGFKIIG
tara:strand:+ start:354 stop:911 length:558 start_codon:yes stop_codon:yes gene_type:complete